MTKSALVSLLLAGGIARLSGGCSTHSAIGGLDSGGPAASGVGGDSAQPTDASEICATGVGGRPGNQPPRTFALRAPVPYDTGGQPFGVAAGDISGDGKPDLIFADSGVGVRIMVNKGNGTFDAPVDHRLDSFPRSVAIGDVSGDHRADIVCVTDRGISVLVNRGGSAFAPAVNYIAGNRSSAVALGDLNGDGRIDIAVANEGPLDSGSTGDVTILTNTGGGSFSAASFPATPQPSSIAIGDVNGDCKADLVVGDAVAGGVAVLLGTGDGTLRPPIAYGFGIFPTWVAIADLNGDGKLDLTAGGLRYDQLYVMLNYGSGTFAAATGYPALAASSSPAIGDLNGDGITDLAVAGDCCGLGVLLNHGDGSFVAPMNFPVAPHSGSVAFGDFDGDGKGDLAVISGNPSATGPDGGAQGSFDGLHLLLNSTR